MLDSRMLTRHPVVRIASIRLTRMRTGFLGALASSLIVAAACSPDHPPHPPPNVILITIDALRADFLSYAGHPHRTSPCLDALARDNVVFTQAVTSYPGTAQAMPSLMTGLFPSFEDAERWSQFANNGFIEFKAPEERKRQGISSNLRMLAEILSDHGYRTLGFHTNPYVSEAWNFNQGFDEYVEFKGYLKRQQKTRSHHLNGRYPPAGVVVKRVLGRLDQGLEPPFFLWIHLMEPHSPYLPPDRFARMFPRAYTDLSDLEVNESVYHLLHAQWGDLEKAARYPSPEDRGQDREALFDHVRGLYEGEIRYCDRQLCRLFEALQEHSLWDDSLAMVTADHGEEFLDHGYVMHHQLSGLTEEHIRIPLILKLPSGGPSGEIIDGVVRMVDFAPTILDFAGLEGESAPMEGVSLRPMIEGRDSPALTAHISSILFGVVRDSRWKYRINKQPQEDGEPTERLFDIVADPMERTDLSTDRPEVLEKMRQRYRNHVEHLRARAAPAEAGAVVEGGDIDPETAERLEALGYANDG